MKSKKRIVLVLSAVSTMVLAGVAAVIATKSKSSISSRAGNGAGWRHYSAVAPTCASFGIKEYWTDCNGNTTIEDPHQEATEYTTSEEDIARIISVYGESDERILAKSDTHGAYEADPNCLGKQLCSLCGEPSTEGAVPTLDFVNNGFYGMYDWYEDYGVADPGWVFTSIASEIHFYTYGYDKYTRVRLPNIYYAGFDCVTIDLTIANAGEKYSFVPDRSVNFVVPSASYATKLVFSNITSSSMNASLRDSSNNILLNASVTNTNIINGTDGFMLYIDCVGLGDELLSNFTFIKDCAHNYAADTNCIGKEICSVCYGERGVATPSFDFSSNLYGAYDIYEPWGADVIQNGWAKSENGGAAISFATHENNGICQFHLPRIYFAGYTSLTIDISVVTQGETYGFDHEFTSSYSTPFSGYPLKLVFEKVNASSMTVKILDAFETMQAQTTCSNSSILNGFEGFVLYVRGVGNTAYDVFSNFTFTI